MADYSGMPPLVDSPQEQQSSSWHPGYAGTTPYTFPAAPPTPGTPWTNAGADQATAGAWGLPPPANWGYPTYGAWPGPAQVMTPGGMPAPLNPAMSAGGDGWPQTAESTPDQRYYTKPESTTDGWPSVRPLTPLSNVDTASPASTASGISRSRSTRSVPGFISESSKRPPREWRADFSMSRSLGLVVGSIMKKARSASISGSILDSGPKMPKLHPWLRYSSSSPPMRFDLRRNPSTVRFRSLDRDINNWDLTRFACEPPVPIMRIYQSQYPWYIDIESQNPTGVTLHELFSALWLSMMTPIAQADYWNNEMDETLRERIAQAWSERCEDDEERAKGVRRVDFLMGRVILEGLVRGREGMWEMKVKKAS